MHSKYSLSEIRCAFTQKDNITEYKIKRIFSCYKKYLICCIIYVPNFYSFELVAADFLYSCRIIAKYIMFHLTFISLYLCKLMIKYLKCWARYYLLRYMKQILLLLLLFLFVHDAFYATWQYNQKSRSLFINT